MNVHYAHNDLVLHMFYLSFEFTLEITVSFAVLADKYLLTFSGIIVNSSRPLLDYIFWFLLYFFIIFNPKCFGNTGNSWLYVPLPKTSVITEFSDNFVLGGRLFSHYCFSSTTFVFSVFNGKTVV